MPLLEYIIQWNQSLVLPAGFEETENWMRASETQLAELTKFLVNFQSPADFVIGLAVIAGLAALGEELFFRGIVLNMLLRSTKKVHLSVIITTVIFTVIHFQFFIN
jgi:membrane protease YdiL (CAAX protease family)